MPATSSQPGGAGRPRGRAWLAALVLAAGCSRSAPAPRVHQVVIHAMTFEPAELTVRAGDTVEWINEDLVPHTATAAGGFDSQVIAPSARWRRTFSARGDLAYGCTLHPTMHARLHVR